MKIKNFIRATLSLVEIATIATPIAIVCTSCSDNFDDKNLAPDDITWTSTSDNTFKDFDFKDPPFYTCSSPTDAFNMFQTSSKYTNNMMKWDLIAAICLANDSPDATVWTYHWDTAHIDQFDRNGIYISIKITFTSTPDGKTCTVYTGQSGATDVQAEPVGNPTCNEVDITNDSYSLWQIHFANCGPTEYYDWCGGKSMFFGTDKK